MPVKSASGKPRPPVPSVGTKNSRTKKPKPAASKGLKLRSLRIKNFKIIDSLELEFPAPRMKGDPDVIIMGSKNGLGKTSVLEACSFLLLAMDIDKEHLIMFRRETSLDLFDLMIRSGTRQAEIKGFFNLEGKDLDLKVQFSRDGKISIDGDKAEYQKGIKAIRSRALSSEDITERFLISLAGLDTDPLTKLPLLYFHSYRKVQEGSPELGMVVERTRHIVRFPYRSRDVAISSFKLDILRSMMSRGGLFENLDDSEAAKTLETLNKLTTEYAGGRVEKLRPSRDNTVEFRVTPVGGGGSFAFDGLSSGQKEIIATLYLIWRHTRKQPGIVLIDEPELHLNAEWRIGFIDRLMDLAPDNQYIIATHSEDIFDSVDSDRRRLLG